MSQFSRTHYCGTLRAEHTGQAVSVCGWAQGRRDLGGLLFIDLRDRTGILQCVCDVSKNAEAFAKAERVRSEYVLCVKGTLARRSEDTVNSELATGEVELVIESLTVLSKAKTPPFEIDDDIDVNELVRLKYRYLDLRRPKQFKSIMMRHKAYHATNNFFDEEGFISVETPMLTKSTPEGARDYLVPSRVHPGQFYALPQSPQQYKQILMLAGVDRYFQLARCFRDEDLRADRQPDFTQVDIEMSFVDVNDVLDVGERYVARLFKEVLGYDVPLPMRRMTYKEAMSQYGSDKPDLRVGYTLASLTDVVKNTGYKVFTSACEKGGVHFLNMKGHAQDFPRRAIDELTTWIKNYRVGGMAWIRRVGGEMTTSFGKFMTEEEMAAILNRTDAQDGDVVFIVGDAIEERALRALGALRLECASRLGLLRKDDYQFLWVTEFPLLEYDEEARRYTACHHPFTSCMDEDVHLLKTDPGKVRSKAYDMVLSGVELGGGSIRIHDSEHQAEMFGILGFTPEQTEEQFGHLVHAFEYGVPPHGGMAFGFDRLVMLMAGAESLRDVIAFPKIQTAVEPMMNCPSLVDAKQLKELHIALDLPVSELK